ncbi:unnamed protein product [Protopolystoma xenopodis]|uniref:Uncharacterized protein n=1 Tax=Protopolystoma xenopodis TaxID=117903 RepID=A0A448XPR5_9PLAT|nr:unnamed protein product [Protopolystoma xenopodis]
MAIRPCAPSRINIHDANSAQKQNWDGTSQTKVASSAACTLSSDNIGIAIEPGSDSRIATSLPAGTPVTLISPGGTLRAKVIGASAGESINPTAILHTVPSLLAASTAPASQPVSLSSAAAATSLIDPIDHAVSSVELASAPTIESAAVEFQRVSITGDDTLGYVS